MLYPLSYEGKGKDLEEPRRKSSEWIFGKAAKPAGRTLFRRCWSTWTEGSRPVQWLTREQGS